MSIHSSRGILAIAAAIGVALCSGCGPYAIYKGKAQSFSTHPFRIEHPSSFETAELPQMSTENFMLVAFGLTKAGAPGEQQTPPMIVIRCYRLRPQETVKAFMERYYDGLAPRFLDIEMRQTKKSSTAPEWSVTAAKGSLQARVIVLPREHLAYDVITVALPNELPHFEAAFKRARASFRLLPARS
jgi:hypothetical protein